MDQYWSGMHHRKIFLNEAWSMYLYAQSLLCLTNNFQLLNMKRTSILSVINSTNFQLVSLIIGTVSVSLTELSLSWVEENQSAVWFEPNGASLIFWRMWIADTIAIRHLLTDWHTGLQSGWPRRTVRRPSSRAGYVATSNASYSLITLARSWGDTGHSWSWKRHRYWSFPVSAVMTGKVQPSISSSLDADVLAGCFRASPMSSICILQPSFFLRFNLFACVSKSFKKFN